MLSKTITIHHYVSGNLLAVKTKLWAKWKEKKITLDTEKCNNLWTFDMWWVDNQRNNTHPQSYIVLSNYLSFTPVRHERLSLCYQWRIQVYRSMQLYDNPAGAFSEETMCQIAKTHNCSSHSFSSKLWHTKPKLLFENEFSFFLST